MPHLAQANNHSRLPTAEEVENFPPDARPVPTNPLPPFKVSQVLEMNKIKTTLGISSLGGVDRTSHIYEYLCS